MQSVTPFFPASRGNAHSWSFQGSDDTSSNPEQRSPLANIISRHLNAAHRSPRVSSVVKSVLEDSGSATDVLAAPSKRQPRRSHKDSLIDSLLEATNGVVSEPHVSSDVMSWEPLVERMRDTPYDEEEKREIAHRSFRYANSALKHLTSAKEMLSSAKKTISQHKSMRLASKRFLFSPDDETLESDHARKRSARVAPAGVGVVIENLSDEETFVVSPCGFSCICIPTQLCCFCFLFTVTQDGFVSPKGSSIPKPLTVHPFDSTEDAMPDCSEDATHTINPAISKTAAAYHAHHAHSSSDQPCDSKSPEHAASLTPSKHKKKVSFHLPTYKSKAFMQSREEGPQNSCVVREKRFTQHCRAKCGGYVRFSSAVNRYIVGSRWFGALITLSILVAGINVGAQTYVTSPILDVLDLVILGIFVAEAVLKLVAEGPCFWHYYRSSWNIFDFAIIICSFLPIPREQVSMLRLIRLLRIIKVIRTMPELRLLVASLIKSLSSLGYITILLFMVFYIYGIMGVISFGANDPSNFGNLHLSFLSLYRMSTGDDWTDIM